MKFFFTKRPFSEMTSRIVKRIRRLQLGLYGLIHSPYSHYAGLLVVFAACLYGASTVAPSNQAKALFALPGSAALLSVLYKFWKDERAHERALDLQARQQDFTFMPASHMAIVAYDKHVQFSEEYLAKVNQTLTELWIEGQSVKALERAKELSGIREKFAAWLTRDVEEQLYPIESALRKIGAGSHVLPMVAPGSHRSKIVEDVYNALREVTEIGEDKKGATASVARITDRLRELLGTKDLVDLRIGIVKLASSRVRH
jgi:hypothetical protein